MSEQLDNNYYVEPEPRAPALGLRRALVFVVSALLMFLAGFYTGSGWRTPEAVDPCAPSQLGQTADVYLDLLQAFDDIGMIAVNLPRSEVVEPTMRMQELRREAEDLDAPTCMRPMKEKLVSFMDGFIGVLVAFIGGAAPDQAMAGLQQVAPLRNSLDAELSLLGIMFTPVPTPIALGIIPVTGEGAAPTLTPTLAFIEAVVQNPDGANLRFGPGVTYSFEHVLPQGAVVHLLGISEDSNWVLATSPGQPEIAGWIFIPLISIDEDSTNLPIISN